MRLSLRIGSAAVLIIIALVYINRNLKTVVTHTPQAFWHFDTTSFRAAALQHQQTPQEAASRKWGLGTGNKASNSWAKTPIEIPNEGVIVMGKLRDQDTAWVSAELAEYVNSPPARPRARLITIFFFFFSPASYSSPGEWMRLNKQPILERSRMN